MGFNVITNVSNAKVKQICAYVAKSKERKKDRIFVVEGRKMFEEAPLELICDVFVTEGFLHKISSKNVLEKLNKTRYELVSETVFSKMSDTKTPQGILCTVRFMEYDLDKLLQIEHPLFLLLEEMQDPGNLGTVVRTGEGAGVDAVFLTNDSVDIYNPKTIRATMGSIFRMPILYIEETAKILSTFSKYGVKTYAAHLDDSVLYTEPDYSVGTAFLIGNEGNGLKKTTADAADQYIKIPMSGSVESLNASIATSLLIYEAARQRNFE
ncbi:MAG: RNA methyltransferase [Lachnospiraceae bacterium]